MYRERVRALERELRYKDEQLTVATRKLQTELDASQTRTKQLTLLREMQKNAEEEIAAKQNECEFLTSRLHAMEEDLKDRDDKIDDMHRKIAELEESVAESRAAARKIEQEGMNIRCISTFRLFLFISCSYCFACFLSNGTFTFCSLQNHM